MSVTGLFKRHLKSLVADILEELPDLAPEAPMVAPEPPEASPVEAPPLQEEEPPTEPPEHPFIKIPDELAFQIRDLVQEKQQMSNGLQFLKQAFTSQTQRLDALYQELRARYEVPKDPGYVLHISEGEGDQSGFQYLERTFPTGPEAPIEEGKL
jgi:hypothetical protein